MALNNAVVKTGGSIAVTGGSDLTFASYGGDSQSLTVGASADTDFRTRRKIDFKISPPKISPNSPSGYTQARAVATFKLPMITASGKYTTNTIQVSMAYDVETSDANKTQMLDVASQMCFDSDFLSFFKNLSLA